MIDNLFICLNNYKLSQSLRDIQTELISLNDVVPFEWDTLYTFAPYASKEEIENLIGFKSSAVKDNHISEGMVHLLFVNHDNVVASILGYQDNLGYCLDFMAKESWHIHYEDHATFDVLQADDIVKLTYAE